MNIVYKNEKSRNSVIFYKINVTRDITKNNQIIRCHIAIFLVRKGSWHKRRFLEGDLLINNPVCVVIFVTTNVKVWLVAHATASPISLI